VGYGRYKKSQKNSTIFFSNDLRRKSSTLASVTYVKTSQVDDHRLSNFDESSARLKWKASYALTYNKSLCDVYVAGEIKI
jgi:hypothetical protein